MAKSDDGDSLNAPVGLIEMDAKRRPSQTFLAAIATVAYLGMIATPLAEKQSGSRVMLSVIVVVGLFLVSLISAIRRWGYKRALIAAGVVAIATTVLEAVGTRTGFPFGNYIYTDSLQPQVIGVPAIVPLAWFAMALPAREVAHAALGGRATWLTRMALGAFALMAWDVFLDPQMVGEGYWLWPDGGWYRDIPMSNFAGWFVSAAVLMLLFERLLPIGEKPDRTPIVQYALVAVLETVGFAFFFDDIVVAVAGGIAMVPLVIVALKRSGTVRV